MPFSSKRRWNCAAARDRARAGRPRPRQAAGGPVEELSCDGQSAPCRAGRSDSAMLAVAALQRVFPCRRMRRPRRVVKTPVPPAIRRAGRIRRPGTGHDIGSLRRQRTRPRATACCQLHARLFAKPARCPARRSAMAVEESPPFARDRDVAPSALAARRPLCRAIAARHVQHLPVPPRTPDASSGDAPGGQVTAADCTMPSLLLH